MKQRNDKRYSDKAGWKKISPKWYAESRTLSNNGHRRNQYRPIEHKESYKLIIQWITIVDTIGKIGLWDWSANQNDKKYKGLLFQTVIKMLTLLSFGQNLKPQRFALINELLWKVHLINVMALLFRRHYWKRPIFPITSRKRYLINLVYLQTNSWSDPKTSIIQSNPFQL